MLYSRVIGVVGWLLVLPVVVVAADAPEWPQFRGPAGQGHALAEKLPSRWSETENIAWKCPLPGKGWSSPVIAGNEIWLTTGIDSPISEEEKARWVDATAPVRDAWVADMKAKGLDGEALIKAAQDAIQKYTKA